VPDRVGRQKAPHHLCERLPSRPEEQMEVVRDQGEGVAVRLRLVEDHAEAVKKEVPVMIVTEDDPPLDTSRNDVMQRTGGIYAGFTGHVRDALQAACPVSSRRRTSSVKWVPTMHCLLRRRFDGF